MVSILMTAKEKTYDRVYGDKENTYDATRDFTASIFRKLRRFKMNHYQSCFSLLTPGKERPLDLGCGDGELLFMAGHNLGWFFLMISRPKVNDPRFRNRRNLTIFRGYRISDEMIWGGRLSW